jgi:hypothetical protein
MAEIDRLKEAFGDMRRAGMFDMRQAGENFAQCAIAVIESQQKRIENLERVTGGEK